MLIWIYHTVLLHGHIILVEFKCEIFGFSKKKIELIKNGVDTNSLRPAEPDFKIRRKLGISNDDKVIVFTCPRGFFSNDLALKYFFQMIPKIEE